MATTLKQPVHVITHRPFKQTSRETASEIGNVVSNPFYDARNISNFDNGEIAPDGVYLNRYPTNVASNSAGFSITDSRGDERNLYAGSTDYGLNALNIGNEPEMQGGGAGGAAGSASDYVYSNPYYASMLYPITRKESQNIMEPLFSNLKYSRAQNVSITGAGTNAPAAASYADYALNNPFMFSSNFSGGALGAPAAGSSSDYYSSDPFRTPAMLREDAPRIGIKGSGAIDWMSFLGQVKTGLHATKAATSVYSAVKSAKEGKKIDAAAHSANAGLSALKTRDALEELKKLRGGAKMSKAEKDKQAKIARGRKLLADMRK